MTIRRAMLFAAPLLLCSGWGAMAQDTDPKGRSPGAAAGQETSDRTPGQHTETPLGQVTKTPGRETSTRTPRMHDSSEASQGGQSAGQEAAAGQQTGRPKVMTIEGLRNSLAQSGFKDVSVVDAAYLVHARTKDGDFVLMMINPPNMSADASAAGKSQGSSATGAAAGNGASGSTGSGASGSSAN